MIYYLCKIKTTLILIVSIATSSSLHFCKPFTDSYRADDANVKEYWQTYDPENHLV